MTTYELMGAARAAGDLDTRRTKALGVAVAALLALGGMAAAAVSTTDRGASARDSLAPPASSTHAPSLAGARVRGSQGASSAAEAIRQGGNGYWTTYGNGAVIANSPAPVYGGESGRQLTRPIVGMAQTPGSNGYWLVASDGGIFNFGDAAYYGSTGAIRLNRPVVGMASTPDGHGYWLVASDGGIFNFGDAGFYGSTGNIKLNRPVVGMASSPDGQGYWLVASDGGIFNFGDAPFHGSAADTYPQAGEQATGIESAGSGGYWIENDAGGVTSMDAPVVASSGPTVQGGSPMPVSQDPSQSQPPSSQFDSSCFGYSFSASACDKAALDDIDNALSAEGYGPLSLPSNYSNLSMPAQLLATANAERTVRGLPAMPENGSLDTRAYQGAQAGSDPTGPSGYAWGSNLAMGYPTALSADYVWMYDDGANSPNVDCQSAGDSGCWGHRHNILIQGGGQAGAAVYSNNGSPNLTQLFVINY